MHQYDTYEHPGSIREWIQLKKRVEVDRRVIIDKKQSTFIWLILCTRLKIIPGYILKAVSINYFWKNIYPQVQGKLIEWLNQKRSEMTQEVLVKWVSLKESTIFPSYQMQLSRVNLYGQIGKAYQNGEDISKDSTVVSFIQQLQKKPEWQK